MSDQWERIDSLESELELMTQERNMWEARAQEALELLQEVMDTTNDITIIQKIYKVLGEHNGR